MERSSNRTWAPCPSPHRLPLGGLLIALAGPATACSEAQMGDGEDLGVDTFVDDGSSGGDEMDEPSPGPDDQSAWPDGESPATPSTAYGWDPGLRTRRVKARNGGFSSNLDWDAAQRSYLLIPVQENGWCNNCSPWTVNAEDGQTPFHFNWGGSGSGTYANLLINSHLPVDNPYNPDTSFTFFGFFEKDEENGSADLPPPDVARWSGELWRDGPYHDSSFAEEDGRVVAGIAWSDSDGVYIVELNLHSGGRRPSWKTDTECLTGGGHGNLKQFIVLGGSKWGQPSMGTRTWTPYDIKWGEILQELKSRNDSCRLKAPLSANARTIEMGASIEVHGRVQERLLIHDVELGSDGGGGGGGTCTQQGTIPQGTFGFEGSPYYSNGTSAYCRCPNWWVNPSRDVCALPPASVMANHGTCNNWCSG